VPFTPRCTGSYLRSIGTLLKPDVRATHLGFPKCPAISNLFPPRGLRSGRQAAAPPYFWRCPCWNVGGWRRRVIRTGRLRRRAHRIRRSKVEWRTDNPPLNRARAGRSRTWASRGWHRLQKILPGSDRTAASAVNVAGGVFGGLNNTHRCPGAKIGRRKWRHFASSRQRRVIGSFLASLT